MAARPKPDVATGGVRSVRRLVLGGALAFVVLLSAALLIYSVMTTPKNTDGGNGLAAFDPDETGRLEQRAWAAYYYRDWPGLFDLLLRLSRSQFNLSLPQALYASYLATRAQVEWARQGERDGAAEASMRAFYEYVKGPVSGQYDSGRAAALEIRWWAVHRQHEHYPDRSALTQALAATYAEVYQVPVDSVVPSAQARAEAMDLSDRWIREGKDPASPLLDQIAERLVNSYRSLRQAVVSETE